MMAVKLLQAVTAWSPVRMEEKKEDTDRLMRSLLCVARIGYWFLEKTVVGKAAVFGHGCVL